MEIKIRDLSKTYWGNVKALTEISLSIPSGMFGLLGPNGAGKTTLIRIIATLIKPSSGEVKIGEYLLSNPRDKLQIRKTLGYLPQELHMYNNLSVREFLSFVSALKKNDSYTRQQEHIDYALQATNLGDIASRRIGTLSGGMKRRLGIAQAIIGDPQLLIVDEPTSGLDPQERVKFRNLLVELARNRTVLLSTHIIEDVGQTCPNLAIINQGQILYSGTTRELIQQTEDKVWELTTEELNVTNKALVISSISTSNGTCYRLLAAEKPHLAATPVKPNLEDAYLHKINSN